MKKLVTLFGIAALLTACSTIDTQKDISNAEASIKGFYSAVEDFNYDAIPTFCTADFSAFEEGFPFKDLNGFLGILKSMEGVTPDISLDFVKTEIMGDMAYSIVEFDATFTNGKVKTTFRTYENYILKKVKGKWLLHYFHSTHLPDPNDRGYSSIHIMNIPKELPVNVFTETLEKYNEAISSIGYADCGYVVLQVIPGSNDDYNYFVKGTWKNKDTYDIIHEHEAFKNVSGEIPESINEYFKDQVYLKVSVIEQ